MYRTAITICTAQWSLYVLHSGHYMYRTAVIICTAQRSLYVPYSRHYAYRTVVTICTAQWSLYVPHCGHYMYRTVVNICTANGHYMYRTMVTICTTSLTFTNATFCPPPPHTHCIYVFCTDVRTKTDHIALPDLLCNRQEGVYCAVRAVP
jgi:hypothetical protein